MKANALFRLVLVLLFFGQSPCLHSQKALQITGTGQTTGHIATITITNTFPNSIFLENTGKSGIAAIALNDPIKKNTFSVSGRHNDHSELIYIPSNSNYQSYIATEVGKPSGQNENGEIMPGASITIPIIGYCTDIHRPPVPDGRPMPDPSAWVHSNDVFLPEEIAVGNGGFSYYGKDLPEYVATNIPGQNLNKPVIINQHNNPVEAAPFLFDAIRKIVITTDLLQSNGLITTPFSAYDARERESVIQQTMWIYSSALNGKTYNKKDFANRMTSQFEQNSGTKTSTATPAVKEQLETGINDFWESFNLVGASAKVLGSLGMSGGPLPDDIQKKLEDALGKDISGVKINPGDFAKEAAEHVGSEGFATGNKVEVKSSLDVNSVATELSHVVQEKKNDVVDSPSPTTPVNTTPKISSSCKCKEFTATAIVVNGEPDVIKPGREQVQIKAEVSKSGNFPQADEYEVPFNYPLKKDDVISISFTDVKLSCACDETPCDIIHGKDPRNTSKKSLDDSRDKINIKNTNATWEVLKRDSDSEAFQDGPGATYKFNAQNDKTAEEIMHFQLRAFCSGPEDCARDICIYDVKIKLKINQKE